MRQTTDTRQSDGNSCRVCNGVGGPANNEPNVLENWQIVKYGNRFRRRGVTAVNPNSSRSHALLQLTVKNSANTAVAKYVNTTMTTTKMTLP